MYNSMVSTSSSTTVLAIRIRPHDARRLRRLTGKESDPHSIKEPGGKIGIRVYFKDKARWSTIVKRAAVHDKIAADIFSEMLDLINRRKNHLRNKNQAYIFREMLNLYEREMLLWGINRSGD